MRGRIERSGFEPRPGTFYSVLCSCARHFTLTVPLSTEMCNWVLVAKFNPTMDLASHPGSSRNILSGFMLQ